MVCSKYEDRIKSMKGFSKTWTDGTESVKKDSLEKHLKGDLHRKACDLELKASLGASSYQENILSSSQIGRGLSRMLEGDKEVSLKVLKSSQISTENYRSAPVNVNTIIFLSHFEYI